MNWFKVSVNDGSSEGYDYVGSSDDTLDTFAEKVLKQDFIKLDDLLYKSEGKVYKWENWDKAVIPTVYIRTSQIIAFMQFKDDPLVTSD